MSTSIRDAPSVCPPTVVLAGVGRGELSACAVYGIHFMPEKSAVLFKDMRSIQTAAKGCQGVIEARQHLHARRAVSA